MVTVILDPMSLLCGTIEESTRDENNVLQASKKKLLMFKSCTKLEPNQPYSLREFEVWWLDLCAAPTLQTTSHKKRSKEKLSPMLHGPYQVLRKVGQVLMLYSCPLLSKFIMSFPYCVWGRMLLNMSIMKLNWTLLKWR